MKPQIARMAYVLIPHNSTIADADKKVADIVGQFQMEGLEVEIGMSPLGEDIYVMIVGRGAARVPTVMTRSSGPL
jgi:hypothetical protein